MKTEIEFMNRNGERKFYTGKTMKASIDFVTAQMREGNTKVASIVNNEGKGWLMENKDGRITKDRIWFSVRFPN